MTIDALSGVKAVPLAKAYRLLNHGPTVLVSSAWQGKRNVMAASWNMALDFDPPKVSVVIDKNTWTRELIESSGEFVLNIPARSLAQETVDVGNCCGRDRDKFAEFGLSTFTGSNVAAPLLHRCVGWLECRVLPEPRIASLYDLFIAEVVAAWADPVDFSDGHWHFTAGRERSIHYIAGGVFFETGEEFAVKHSY